jgi:hypothetical protein
MDSRMTIFDLQNVSYATDESAGHLHGAPMGQGYAKQVGVRRGNHIDGQAKHHTAGILGD